MAGFFLWLETIQPTLGSQVTHEILMTFIGAGRNSAPFVPNAGAQRQEKEPKPHKETSPQKKQKGGTAAAGGPAGGADTGKASRRRRRRPRRKAPQDVPAPAPSLAGGEAPGPAS
jgi:hypothetical protein